MSDTPADRLATLKRAVAAGDADQVLHLLTMHPGVMDDLEQAVWPAGLSSTFADEPPPATHEPTDVEPPV